MFKRTYGEEEILVVINNNDENKKIDLNFTYRGVDLMNNVEVLKSNLYEIYNDRVKGKDFEKIIELLLNQKDIENTLKDMYEKIKKIVNI